MSRIEFSDFAIDLKSFELTRRGEPVSIGPKPLDLLICLIENRDRVVDQDFLRREVWESTALSSATIPTCILEVRRALHDSPDTQEYIATYRGRGYRFIAEAKVRAPRGSVRNNPDSFPFVGRDRELDGLREALASVRHRQQGQVVLIEGEAGIGKTRLLREFLESTLGRMQIFRTRSPSIDETPAFWPWTQLLNDALARVAALPAETTRDVAELSRFFPEIESDAAARESPRRYDRFEIFRVWTRIVRSLATNEPTIIALEDVHRADPDSLALLYWVADEIENDPILIVATLRPPPTESNVADTVSAISAMPHANHLRVSPLSPTEVEQLVGSVANDVDAISQTLFSRTGGIPFYVTHLLQNLRDDGDELDLAKKFESALVENGREIVARQLSDLPHETRDLLGAAATIGDRFSLAFLAEVLDLASAVTMSRIEPAFSSGLVQIDQSEVQFRHSLLRDALYQQLSRTRRFQLHFSVARRMMLRADSTLRAAEISDHLAKSGLLPPAQLTRKFALLAGRAAASRFAFDRARTYLERALATTLDSADATLSQRYDVLVELAEAEIYLGDRASARTRLLQAADLARALDSPQMLARCALNMSPDFLSIEFGTYDETLVSLLEESLSRIQSESLADRAQLLARLSQARKWHGYGSKNEELAVESLRLAERSGDCRALVAAYAARVESLNGPHRAADRIELLRESEPHIAETADTPARLLHGTRSIAALLELGRIRELELAIERCRQLSHRTGLAQYTWLPIARDCMLAMMRGDLRKAEALVSSYGDLAGDNPDQNVTQTIACQQANLFVERDEAREFAEVTGRIARSRKSVMAWRAAALYLQWDAGSLDEATRSLDEFSRRDILAASQEVGGGLTIAVLSEVAASLNRRDYAEFLLRLVEPIADRFVSTGYGVLYFGSFARYAGLLAHCLGDHAHARRHLEKAVQAESAVGAVSWKMYAEIDLIRLDFEVGRKTPEARAWLTEIAGSGERRTLPRVTRRAEEVLRSLS